MRLPVKEFVQYCIDHYSLADPILDVCAGWEPNFYQPLFPGSTYLKQDQIQFDPPTIDYICDAHNMMPIENSSIETVLLLEALEHIQKPQKVVDEIFRILRPGGYCIVTTLTAFEIHRTPYDYWRFCPDGICYIFRSFHILEIVLEHHRTFPRGIWSICKKPDKSNNIPNEVIEDMPAVYVHESGKSALKIKLKRLFNKMGIDIIRVSKNPEKIEVIGQRETSIWKGSLK